MEIIRNINAASEEENFYYFFEHNYSIQFHGRRIIAANSIIFNEAKGEQEFTHDQYVTKASIQNYFDVVILEHFNSPEFIQKAKVILPSFIGQVETYIDYTKLMKVSLNKDHYPECDYDEIYDYARVILAKAMMPKENNKKSPIEWYDTFQIDSSHFEKLLNDAYYFIEYDSDSKFQKPAFNFSFALYVMMHLHLTDLLKINELDLFTNQIIGERIVNQN